MYSHTTPAIELLCDDLLYNSKKQKFLFDNKENQEKSTLNKSYLKGDAINAYVNECKTFYCNFRR